MRGLDAGKGVGFNGRLLYQGRYQFPHLLVADAGPLLFIVNSQQKDSFLHHPHVGNNAGTTTFTQLPGEFCNSRGR